MNPRRVWAVMEKEFLFVLRDPRSLGVTLLLPVMLLILFGYAINFDVRGIRLAVYDPDGTSASRDLVRALTSTGYFRLVRMLESPGDADEMLAAGRAQVALSLPTDFAADLAAGRPTEVQTIINGSDSLTANVSRGYLEAILQDWSLRREPRARGGRELPIEPKVRIWFNEDLSSVRFITPGLVVVILMLLAALLTSQTIVREREQGTMEGLVVSPITAREILSGKLLPYVVIALVDVGLVALAGRLLFHLPMRGNLAVTLALLLVYLLAALGTGLLISVVTRSQQVAYMIALIGTLLPTMLLTGFIFPVSSMPRVLQVAVQFHPATHFMVIARAASLRGADWADLWPRALALLGLAAFLLTLAAARFRKTL